MLTEIQEDQIIEYLEKKRCKANSQIQQRRDIEYGYTPKELQARVEQDMQEALAALWAAVDVAKLAGVDVERLYKENRLGCI